ncbi:hypothetical protein HX127_11300 [Acinetobacter sp. 256-1]|uniref:hypothetical protein n=1 Tax=Acinetobacter sp. 256-1 TaxID=2746721 RepID=UPI002577D67A|nr:hypothetical protein [Acinetobacter sp. 256-1]MDM1758145.1 hypothetical protein [Acinetobacter sp. 256-1]
MGYIIKLISENSYIIPDDDGWMTTTKSKQEAIEIGAFDDFDSANETASDFSGGMIRGVDYVIENTSSNPYHVVQISIPVEIAPKLKDIDKFIKNNKALVYLTNNTTSNDALNGFKRYGVSTGSSAILLTSDMYEKSKAEIAEYLNERFGENWEVQLQPVQV